MAVEVTCRRLLSPRGGRPGSPRGEPGPAGVLQWIGAEALNEASVTSDLVQPFLSSARRYRWVVLGILLIVWGTGLAAAYIEYKSTYEAKSTIWVLKAATDLTVSNPSDPNVPLVQTAASQQAELLNQLLATRSFVRDVIGRTSMKAKLDTASNESPVLDDVRRHFKVATIGPNMLTVAFDGRDPVLAADLVQAALDVRQERLTRARVDGTSALGALYQQEFDAARSRVLDAQRALQEFTASHPTPLSDIDQHQLAQLRVSFDLAQVRVSDLQGRIDQSVLGPALLEISGLEFQIVDPPRAETTPTGGTKNATTLALIAFVTGIVLAGSLVLVGTLALTHVAGPADVSRLAPAALFASVPRVRAGESGAGRDLRTALAAMAFADASTHERR
jgi:uncharacterized protein involved in exopolysaccharide biosynthesis